MIETKELIEEISCFEYDTQTSFIEETNDYSNDYLKKIILENINIQEAFVSVKNEYIKSNIVPIYPSNKLELYEEIKIYLDLFGNVFFTKYNNQISSIYSKYDEKIWNMFLTLYDKKILNADVIEYFDYNKNYKNVFKSNVLYRFISNKKTSINIMNNELFSLFLHQKSNNINAGIASFLTTKDISELVMDKNIVSLQKYVGELFFMPYHQLRKTWVCWKIV